MHWVRRNEAATKANNARWQLKKNETPMIYIYFLYKIVKTVTTSRPLKPYTTPQQTTRQTHTTPVHVASLNPSPKKRLNVCTHHYYYLSTKHASLRKSHQKTKRLCTSTSTTTATDLHTPLRRNRTNDKHKKKTLHPLHRCLYTPVHPRYDTPAPSSWQP